MHALQGRFPPAPPSIPPAASNAVLVTAFYFREPLNKFYGVAHWLCGMGCAKRGASNSHRIFASRATKQTARKASARKGFDDKGPSAALGSSSYSYGMRPSSPALHLGLCRQNAIPVELVQRFLRLSLASTSSSASWMPPGWRVSRATWSTCCIARPAALQVLRARHEGQIGRAHV